MMERLLTGAVLIVLITQPSCSGYFWNSKGSSVSPPQNLPSFVTKPEFEDTETEIVAHVGGTSFLPCRVKNLGDRMVSWIRTKDLHILVAGTHTFTSDVRFTSGAARTHGRTANWGLELRNTQPTDAGMYECQVSTEPKINRKVRLEVDENLRDSPHSLTRHALDEAARDISEAGPATKILGPEEQFIQEGSTITLTCLVIPIDNRLTSVDWLKDGRQVSFQASRGGISVLTDRSDKKTTSSLTVADVTVADSGNYTCRPQRCPMHSIQLHILQGEVMGAMHGGFPNSATESPNAALFCLFICFALTLFYQK